MRFAHYILYFKRRTTQALIAKKDSLYLSANVISSAVLIGSPVQREKYYKSNINVSKIAASGRLRKGAFYKCGQGRLGLGTGI